MVENPGRVRPLSKAPGYARPSEVCLSDKEIEDHIFSRLPTGCREGVEEHLLYCDSCLSRVEEEEQFVTEFRAVAQPMEAECRPKPAVAGWFNWLPLPVPAWAGAAVLSLALILLIPRSKTPDSYQEIALSVFRGPAAVQTASATAGQPVRFSIDLTELPKLPRYHLQLVNSLNQVLAGEDIPASGAQLSWAPDTKLQPGTYWIRLQEANGEGTLLREFGLAVR